MDSTLCSAFLDALPAPQQRQPSAELNEALAQLLDTAHAAHPELGQPAPTFLKYIASRLAADAALPGELRRLPAADLYLACACLLGVPAALQRFEEIYIPQIDACLRRMGTAPPVGAELKQHLRVKLLVGEGGAAPKLAQYSGAGSLSAWVRVVTMREVQMARRKVQREVPADDLAAAAIDGADLEIGYLKQRYGAEFREALAHALQNLSARERNLLRLHYLHGKGIDQIAAIYHVGRSTAARWLIKIRADLFSQVQSHLMQRLRITPTEFDSLARLVRSQLEISITGLLDSHAAGRTAEEK